MIAENKVEFFEELERELQRLGVEDTSELFADLEEHFAEGERRGLGEDEVCRELGSIREIARSCLDIKSSAINSMVAHEATRKKAVSLTKPGRDVPADPSLAKPREDTENKHEAEDAVRSFTPEHIAEEVVPSGSGSSANPDSAVPESAPQSENPQNPQAEKSQDNPQDNTQNESPNNPQEVGMFEKIGKKVDAACDKAGQALNDAIDKAGTKVNDALKKSPFSPSDNYRSNVNDSRHGEIPKQSVKAKTKDASKFVDVSQLTPNVKPGRLLGEIILDVLLWVWLVPVAIVGALAMFVAAAGIVLEGVAMLLGFWSEFGRYFLPTRILFALGFFALASFVACLASVLVKPAFALPKYVVRRHIRAVYDV